MEMDWEYRSTESDAALVASMTGFILRMCVPDNLKPVKDTLKSLVKQSHLDSDAEHAASAHCLIAVRLKLVFQDSFCRDSRPQC